MHTTDKRLIDRLAPAEQKTYFTGLKKTLSDAADKCDELIVEHEDINLLETLRTKKTTAPLTIEAADVTESDQD